MRVTKWGNSLGLRLPKRVVDDLGLKAGDELSLVQATGRMFEFEVRQRRELPPSRRPTNPAGAQASDGAKER